MAQSIDECKKNVDKLQKLITDNSEVESIMKTSDMNEWQFKAFARLKQYQERLKLFALILKMFSEVNVLTAFIGALLSWFSI